MKELSIEEKAKAYDRAINILDASKAYTTSPDKYEDTINWLKSLRLKKQWKPSKKQMEALLSEVEAWTKGCPKQVILESLYNDLKKLREG